MVDSKVVDSNFRHLVRISNTDLDGNKKLIDSIRKIKGISFSFANAICKTSGVPKNEKLGNVSEADVKKLQDAINDASSRVPQWMLNRRRNLEDDTSKHLVTTDLSYAQENDIRQMQRIRSYRGIRHMSGSPSRGQRTRSNFRRNKGKVLGVAKSKTGKTGGK